MLYIVEKRLKNSRKALETIAVDVFNIVERRLNPLPESEQFRFWRAARLANLKDSVGLISAKASALRVTIPTDRTDKVLSTRPSYLYLAVLTLVKDLPFLLHLWF